MTVGGLSDRPNVNLYSLEEGQSVPECLQNLQQLPTATAFGAGAALGALGDIPLICGGTSGSTACYRYMPMSNEWVHSGNLTQTHKGPGYTRHSQLGLVITGNIMDNGQRHKISETTLDGENMKVS